LDSKTNKKNIKIYIYGAYMMLRLACFWFEGNVFYKMAKIQSKHIYIY